MTTYIVTVATDVIPDITDAQWNNPATAHLRHTALLMLRESAQSTIDQRHNHKWPLPHAVTVTGADPLMQVCAHMDANYSLTADLATALAHPVMLQAPQPTIWKPVGTHHVGGRAVRHVSGPKPIVTKSVNITEAGTTWTFTGEVWICIDMVASV